MDYFISGYTAVARNRMSRGTGKRMNRWEHGSGWAAGADEPLDMSWCTSNSGETASG